MRGGAVTLADALAATVADHGPPDALVASDMVDLAGLLGLTRRVLGDPAVGLYLHEEQIVTGLGPAPRRDREFALTSWRNLVAADHVFVNSACHRDALVDALDALLAGGPDRPHNGHRSAVVAKLSVLHPGVDLTGIVDGARTSDADRGEPPLILWNQRWDHDKRPEALFRVLVKLAEHGVAFRLALAGENRRVDPREFDDVRRRLGDRVVHVGHLDRPGSVELLLRSDLVVSTARHEWFGMAVVEAIAAGAVPVLPDRLVFPELLPAWSHDAALYRSRLYDRLAAVLSDLDGARRRVEGLRGAMAAYGWAEAGPRTDAALDALVAGRRGDLGYRPGP
jgi:glycosyltransferase involved in cell wall biosynthesis